MKWIEAMITICIIIVISLLLLMLSENRSQPSSEHRTIIISEDGPEMKKAIERALAK